MLSNYYYECRFITTAGLTFGGYPVGSDEYIHQFLITKSKKFSEL